MQLTQTQLEAAGNQTAVVSPLDDLRGEIKRFKPDLIVLTGGLGEPSNIQIVLLVASAR